MDTPDNQAAPQDAVAGNDPSVTFADLGLSDRVLKALRDVGYETPSPIQAQTIPILLTGRDAIGLAQTGTGKTAAFALPVLSNIDTSSSKPQALVLCPTRELALQVAGAFEKYAAHIRGLSILAIYGGQGYGVQLSALRRGVQIVVGTPGRIMDHLEKGTLDLSEVKFLVLDEADEMLKMGFAEDVDTILAETPGDKQVALFSATMPKAIRNISQKHLHDPAEITVKSKTATAANVTQRYLMVSYPQKVDALTRILEVENFDGMIVFVRTKHETEMLAEKLRTRGFSAAAINGDIAQPVRERMVQQLKDAKLDILVATDVAARGLDVERISHVVNYDIPTDTEAYVHRIGRTGRAGRSGDAISFVTPRERHLLKSIEKTNRTQLIQMQLPSVDDVNATRLSRFDEAITEAMASPRMADFRGIVEHYVRNYDVTETDVAAALAIVAQGEEPLLLEPDREPRREPRREDRRESGPRDSSYDGDREQRRERRPRREGDGNFTTYRIAVGKRHKVDPRMIVGAIANEGKLNRADFGHIDIRADHSLVELPTRLSPATWDALKGTRISGKLIELRPDRGDKGSYSKAPRSSAPRQAEGGYAGDRPERKPRTKKKY